MLAVQAPVTLLGTLLAWLALFLVGFSLLFMAFGASLAMGLRDAGASLFALGFAVLDATSLTITVLAAATGLVVVALQIGYLPTLYAAYNRRESLVTVLASRTGVPAWGPEVLVRHQLVGITDSMPDLYSQWESFAADVAESHTNYPVLVYFRSPHPYRSWVIGLLAVLDSAALYLALAPSHAPSEARLCLRMGYTCLRDIAGTLGIAISDDPRPTDPVQLSEQEFAHAVGYIQSSGFPVERSAAQAWPDFRGWRVNYEHAATALAQATEAPHALWSGGRRLRSQPIAPGRPRDACRRRPAQRGHRPAAIGDRASRSRQPCSWSPAPSGVGGRHHVAVAELAVAVSVQPVHQRANEKPDDEANPGDGLQLADQPQREHDAQQRRERHERGAEGPRQFG